MSERANDPLEPMPSPYALRDVHSPEFWQHSWANIRTDLENLRNLPPETPPTEVQRQQIGVLVAITLHQERVLEILARATAPKPKRPYTRRAKAASSDEQPA
jgi:hypothetical protein